MANVLLTWELGGGMGHATTLLPLAKDLCRKGHRVYLALKDLPRTARMFAGLDVFLLQAPIKTQETPNPISPTRTFAQILHNIGFGNFDELRFLAEGWRSLYRCVQPNLIVFDHSPTALLAARDFPAKRALIGTGFCCPPDVAPFPDLRAWLGDESESFRRDEDRVLGNVNQVLTAWGIRPLDHLAQLYAEVDEQFLTTFKELDHYPARANGRYRGVCGAGGDGGDAPDWPQGNGKRIFAYLKPFPALPGLLGLLQDSQSPTLIYGPGIHDRLRDRFQSATLRFARRPVDMRATAEECDLAILNGTHGTTAAMLLAGKPSLQIPIFLEQALSAQAVSKLGAGLFAMPDRADRIAQHFDALLQSAACAEAARRFAARYARPSPEQQLGEDHRAIRGPSELKAPLTSMDSRSTATMRGGGHAFPLDNWGPEKEGLYVKYRLTDEAVCEFLRSLRMLGERRLAEIEQITRQFLEGREGKVSTQSVDATHDNGQAPGTGQRGTADAAARALARKYRITSRFYDILDYPWERQYRRWRPALLKGVGGTVLEAGVGTGRNLPHYPADAKVTALDLCPGMVRIGANRGDRILPGDAALRGCHTSARSAVESL